MNKNVILDNLYKECSVKNWDGYGAEPLCKELREVVEKFLNLLPNNIPDPDIIPDTDGEISLDWYREKNTIFSISIGKNNQLNYAFRSGNGKESYCGSEIFNDKIPKPIIGILNIFFKD